MTKTNLLIAHHGSFAVIKNRPSELSEESPVTKRQTHSSPHGKENLTTLDNPNPRLAVKLSPSIPINTDVSALEDIASCTVKYLVPHWYLVRLSARTYSLAAFYFAGKRMETQSHARESVYITAERERSTLVPWNRQRSSRGGIHRGPLPFISFSGRRRVRIVLYTMIYIYTAPSALTSFVLGRDLWTLSGSARFSRKRANFRGFIALIILFAGCRWVSLFLWLAARSSTDLRDRNRPRGNWS